MGLFDRFKAKKPTHAEKVNLAYKCYKADLVEAVFPGKEAQADRIIRSLALIYGIDLETCDAKKYYDILSTYSDIWIRKNITQTNDELATASLVVKHGDLVKDMATAQVAYSYITKTLSNSTFVLESREDLKKLNPLPAKATTTPAPAVASTIKAETPKPQQKQIKLEISRCSTLDGMISVLETFCVSVISAHCKGSGDKYGSLPILPVLTETDIEEIATDILLHVKKGAPDEKEPINQAAYNAACLGMASAKMMIKDNPVSPSKIKERFLKERTTPSWLPNDALMMAGVVPRTDYSEKIKALLSEMTCDFSRAVSYASSMTDDEMNKRAITAIGIAYKAGCSIFLRDQAVIQGNHSEEDQEKLNSTFGKKNESSESLANGPSEETPEDIALKNAEVLFPTLSGSFVGYQKFPVPSYWSREFIHSFQNAIAKQVRNLQRSDYPINTSASNAAFIGMAMGYAYRMYDKDLVAKIKQELINPEADPLLLPRRAFELMNNSIDSPYGEQKVKQIKSMTRTVDVAATYSDDREENIRTWHAYIWAGFRAGIAIYMYDEGMIHGKVFVEDQRVLDEFFKGI